jgi:hypothetical protein
LAGYLCGVIFTALGMGLLFDAILDYFDMTISVTMGQHDEMTSLLYSVAAVVLASLIAFQYGKKAKAFFESDKMKKLNPTQDN